MPKATKVIEALMTFVKVHGDVEVDQLHMFNDSRGVNIQLRKEATKEAVIITTKK